jgi:uncharacterized protein (DUF2252 family)
MQDSSGRKRTRALCSFLIPLEGILPFFDDAFHAIAVLTRGLFIQAREYLLEPIDLPLCLLQVGSEKSLEFGILRSFGQLGKRFDKLIFCAVPKGKSRDLPHKLYIASKHIYVGIAVREKSGEIRNFVKRDDRMKDGFRAPKSQKRAGILETQRRLKMARSAHAYVRGNTLHFYEWLKTPGAAVIPQGPPIWICGDCHVGNIGPVATSDGSVELEIRDLDQTVIGNPAHDLVRLGLSLATAARGSDLPGVTTARMVEQMIGGYRNALKSAKKPSKKALVSPIEDVLKRALRRRWKNLAEERIEDVRPQIPLGKRFWELTKKEAAEIKNLFATESVRKMVTALKDRKDNASIEVVDAAYWMKGCSSLGRLRYAVLLHIGNKKEPSTYCLIDIKESAAAAAPRHRSSKVFRNHAKRLVEGACQLSPFLGERMVAAVFLGRPVVLRELMPQDLKLEMETLTIEEAVGAARHLAFVVGRAHARQLSVQARRRWDAALNHSNPNTLAAPSWLWKRYLLYAI